MATALKVMCYSILLIYRLFDTPINIVIFLLSLVVIRAGQNQSHQRSQTEGVLQAPTGDSTEVWSLFLELV